MMQITYYPTRNITVYTVYEKDDLICLNYYKGYPFNKKIQDFEPDKLMMKLFNTVVNKYRDIEYHEQAIFEAIDLHKTLKQ